MSPYEATMFAALFFRWHFFAFLRVGELVVGDWTCFILVTMSQYVKQKAQLSLNFLTQNKSIWFRGCDNAAGNETCICPHKLVQNYIVCRGHANGVFFFCNNTNAPVTRYQFSAVLKKSLGAIGIRSSGYKSHSFRVGAATFTAMNGFSDDNVKDNGSLGVSSVQEIHQNFNK